tara:strand:+ start:171 stop:464 length:294 start_codon:yes stop_codon:yes gene_type:complete
MERLSKSAFKLRSGNKPSASKLMGVSPVKHTEIIKPEGDDLGNVATGIATTNPQMYSGNQATRGKALESIGMGDIYGQKSFPRNLRENFGLARQIVN